MSSLAMTSEGAARCGWAETREGGRAVLCGLDPARTGPHGLPVTPCPFSSHSRLTHMQAFAAMCPGPINCCAFVSEVLLAAGTDGGHVLQFDIRNPG